MDVVREVLGEIIDELYVSKENRGREKEWEEAVEMYRKYENYHGNAWGDGDNGAQ